MPVLRVYDLPFSKFQLAAPLLRQAWFDEAYIEMVLEGIQPGRIFVDRLDHPEAALLCHPYEFYVAGDCSPGSPLRQFIKDYPAEPDIFHTLYGYCGVGHAWETALVEDSSGLLRPVPRRNFKFRRPAPLLDWRAFIPPHAALKRIDASLALQVDRDFHQSINRYWGNPRRSERNPRSTEGNEARSDIDVDLLVEFSQSVGLFILIDLKNYLEDLLGCSVDLGPRAR